MWDGVRKERCMHCKATDYVADSAACATAPR
jgi:hypothetical protein